VRFGFSWPVARRHVEVAERKAIDRIPQNAPIREDTSLGECLACLKRLDLQASERTC
jgi:hypothetical protein